MEPDSNSGSFCDVSERFLTTSEISKSLQEERRSAINVRSRNLNRIQIHRAHSEVRSGREASFLDGSGERRIDYFRRNGLRARANLGGAAFNIINMAYNDSPDGKKLKLHDDYV
jgi:hypothetical protein